MGERVNVKSNGSTAGDLARPHCPGPGIVASSAASIHPNVTPDLTAPQAELSGVFAPGAAAGAWAKTLALLRRELGG